MENQPQKKSNTKVMAWLVGLVMLMFVFAYSLVPLYNALCSVWGINGKTGEQTQLSTQVDTSRWVTVEFVTTVNGNLPWKFYPMETKVKVHPGENRLVKFFAENDSGKTMTVQAIPSFSPGLVAKYLKKTQCFCFQRETFTSGESKEMPVVFHIDPELPKDIDTVTLSYTLFDTAGIRSNSNKIPGQVN